MSLKGAVVEHSNTQISLNSQKILKSPKLNLKFPKDKIIPFQKREVKWYRGHHIKQSSPQNLKEFCVNFLTMVSSKAFYFSFLKWISIGIFFRILCEFFYKFRISSITGKFDNEIHTKFPEIVWRIYFTTVPSMAFYFSFLKWNY